MKKTFITIFICFFIMGIFCEDIHFSIDSSRLPSVDNKWENAGYFNSVSQKMHDIIEIRITTINLSSYNYKEK